MEKKKEEMMGKDEKVLLEVNIGVLRGHRLFQGNATHPDWGKKLHSLTPAQK